MNYRQKKKMELLRERSVDTDLSGTEKKFNAGYDFVVGLKN
jgi:hypothetical protein